MKRLAVGWVVATAIALAFSLGAVAQVRNRVIEPAVEIPATLAAATTTTTTEEPVDHIDGEEPATATTATTTTIAPSTSTTSTTTTSVAPVEAKPPISTTTTTAPPTTTTTTAPPPSTTTTTTTAPPIQPSTSTYTLVGGVVTISYSPGVVNFVSAIPEAGFSTEQLHTGPDEVRINFNSETHSSEFRAEWENGVLDIKTSEESPDQD